MKNKLVKFIAIVLMSAPLASFAMPILDVDGSGQLLGASGVDVNGTLYDVQFMDGTCAALFTGCDSEEDFVFNNLMDALAASDALLAQVLLDSPSGQFDSMPHLTVGCSDPSDCFFITPYTLSVGGTLTTWSANRVVEQGDGISGPNTLPNNFDITLVPDFTWVVWSATPTAVVEPNTGLLALLGLFALRLSRRLNAK